MHPYRESSVTKIVLIVFFIAVLFYAYFEARGLLFGPSITVAETFLETTEQYIEIHGTAQHIADLKMNGGSVPVTETGAFNQPYVLAPGYNRIVLDAKDKYGKATQKVIEVVYTPGTSSTLSVNATSSPQTASSTPVVAQ